MATAAKDQQRQTLEHFILVENCLIAELHRLASITPREFFGTNNEKINRLIVDFAYFKNPRIVDELIEKDGVRLIECWLKSVFWRNYACWTMSLQSSVDRLLHSSKKSWMNCAHLFETLLSMLNSTEIFYSITFFSYTEKFRANENVMDPRFSEIYFLRCNVLFLLGITLFLLDSKFPGLSKERIFVAHTRIR